MRISLERCAYLQTGQFVAIPHSGGVTKGETIGHTDTTLTLRESNGATVVIPRPSESQHVAILGPEQVWAQSLRSV